MRRRRKSRFSNNHSGATDFLLGDRYEPPEMKIDETSSPNPREHFAEERNPMQSHFKQQPIGQPAPNPSFQQPPMFGGSFQIPGAPPPPQHAVHQRPPRVPQHHRSGGYRPLPPQPRHFNGGGAPHPQPTFKFKNPPPAEPPIPDPRLEPVRNQTKRRLESPTFPTPVRKKQKRRPGEGVSLLQLPRISESEANDIRNMYSECIVMHFRECEALHLEYFKIFPKKEGVIINVAKKELNSDKRLGDRYRIKVLIHGGGAAKLEQKITEELKNVKFTDKVHKISPDTCTVLNHYGGIAMRTIRQKLHCSIRLRNSDHKGSEGHSEVCISGEHAQVMLAMKRVQKLYMGTYVLSAESKERLLMNGRELLSHYQKNPHCVFILSGSTMKIMGSPKEFKKLMRELRRNLGKICFKTITVPKAFLEKITKEKALQLEGKHRVNITQKTGFKTQMMRSLQVTGVDFDVRNCIHDLDKIWRKFSNLPEVDLIPDSDRAEIHRPPKDWRERFYSYQKAYLPAPLHAPEDPATNLPQLHIPPSGSVPNSNPFSPQVPPPKPLNMDLPKPPSPVFAPQLPSPNLTSPIFSTPVNSLFDDVEPAPGVYNIQKADEP